MKFRRGHAHDFEVSRLVGTAGGLIFWPQTTQSMQHGTTCTTETPKWHGHLHLISSE